MALGDEDRLEKAFLLLNRLLYWDKDGYSVGVKGDDGLPDDLQPLAIELLGDQSG